MDVVCVSRVCRCCYEVGMFKDLVSNHSWMGDVEVYGDLLRECFELNLIKSENDESSGICEVCITQLRNASNFKKQVLRTEELFKKNLLGAERNAVKLEIMGSELGPDDIDHLDNEDDPVPDFVPVNYDSDVPIKAEINIKEETTVKKKKRKLKIESGTSDSKSGKRVKKKKSDKVYESATPERHQHRVNLTTILQHSTASPFRDKTSKGFSCLYCCKYFKNITDLRYHTAQQSEKDKLNLMIDYKLSYNPIKVDITDLQCTVCDMEVNDLADLKDHLVNIHNKVIHNDIKDIILPFRLEDGKNFRCVVCSVVHVSFKNLYQHMSTHYSNYCCNECGTGYITIAALRKHGKTHENGSFPCDYCSKVYTSVNKKRQHERGVHTAGWLRNKCPYCPKLFVSYYDKSEHLVKEHNEAPIIYPCNACDKIYKKKYELNRHIKHHHLQQRNYKCEQCNARYFSRRGLLDHEQRHSGVVQFTCEVCGKKFSRMRSLNEHIRVHEGKQKKYECEICKKTFNQKCSLKSHIRLHQDDLDIFKEFDDVKHLIDNRDITLKQIAQENRIREAGGISLTPL